MIALMAKPNRKERDDIPPLTQRQIAQRCLEIHLSRGPGATPSHVLEHLADELRTEKAITWKIGEAGFPAAVVEGLDLAGYVLMRQLVEMTIDEFMAFPELAIDDLEATVARMRELRVRFSPTKADRRAFAMDVNRECPIFGGTTPAERLKRWQRYVYLLAQGKSMRDLQGLTGLSTRSRRTHTAGGIAKAKIKAKIAEEWDRWESAENLALLMGFRRGCIGWIRITRYIARTKRELELDAKLAAECATRQALTHRVREELTKEGFEGGLAN